MRFSIVAVLLMLVCSTANAGQIPDQTNWTGLKQAFEEYVNAPTDKNVEKVISFLPKDRHARYDNSVQQYAALRFVFDRNQIGILERQVLAGDSYSVRLAFNLFAVSDGHYTETLHVILGSLIRIDSLQFLEGFREYYSLDVGIDGLVGNLGFSYVDRTRATCSEIQKRIVSLQEVTKPTLLDVRDECIESLRDFIQQYCNELE